MSQPPGSGAPHHFLHLPEAPAGLDGPVKAWSEDVEILTYAPQEPTVNPMFLEKRVYQGSSGRVYPLPFIDRVATEPAPRMWKALHIENEFLRMMILPEIGGRIHVGHDKTSGYDFFYRQNVIKPALVGLAGPWASGGVEFNWPQHHRPATFMPVETEIEQHSDGSVTVWCSDHDPMLRMKGMHGICLHPDRAVLELKVRLFNRTQFTQTFLWWANVAARVHEQYQSFFPPDVRFVADHAKRAVTSFPRSANAYYGVDYAERGRTGVPVEERPAQFRSDGSYAADDLSWYANIPVPTSYMIAGTEGDFFGGYDHKVDAGFVHVADRHIAPGKKQWTWGNHDFGYAWDRSLTDTDGPYIELMAGAYTDNQPDFSYLAPWETKTFTQTWYPIHAIGVPVAASTDAALSIHPEGEEEASFGLITTHSFEDVTVTVHAQGRELYRWSSGFLKGAHPLVQRFSLPQKVPIGTVSVTVVSGSKAVLAHDPATIVPAKAPKVAVEPAAPELIESSEVLYLTGLHLAQYRHATRRPEIYWLEALKRDHGDSRCRNAMGLWHLSRGEFESARESLEIAISRLTALNPNPYDGEPYYNLGITLRHLQRQDEAYDALYKATWNAAWRGPAYFALAEIDASRKEWQKALDHLQRSLKAEADNFNASNLLGYMYEQLGDVASAQAIYRQIAALDPLDIGTRWRGGRALAGGQEILDLTFDLLRSGRDDEARRVLGSADLSARDGSVPIILLVLAQVESRTDGDTADATYQRALASSLDLCFPSRLEELVVLEATLISHPGDGAAGYLLGNLLYDRRRHHEAIAAWQAAVKLMPAYAPLWRNLGIGYFNVERNPTAAVHAFDQAILANPRDGRVLYERDQLWKRIGETPQRRLTELQRFPELRSQRDDLSVELATLFNQLHHPEQALDLLLHRRFQPWEGGEGLVLAQFVRAHLLLGQSALNHAKPALALEHFQAALTPPENLGEARHLLTNQSDLYYWMGVTLDRLSDAHSARTWWQRAASNRGDFQQMEVREISEMTYWVAVSRRCLGDRAGADELFVAILAYAEKLATTEPTIDYFATSLPAMLLFEDDLTHRQRIRASFLKAQALAGLQRTSEAEAELASVLQQDLNHAAAADLLEQLSTQSTDQPS